MNQGAMNQRTGLRIQRTGIHLVQVPRTARAELPMVREATTGRVISMLPRVWAVAETAALVPTHDDETVVNGPPVALPVGVPSGSPAAHVAKVEVAFYRKYTEAMLRRYLKLSTNAGRTPSLLGRELFRGYVSSYRMHSFDDVVIFCLDMEKCLGKLERLDRELLQRIAIQQYSQGEAAALLGISFRTTIRRYGAALDRFTRLLLAAGMMEPLQLCQEQGRDRKPISTSL